MNKSRILLYFKGVAMGAADIVPGVSGGTIAFIAGIYEELVESIKSLNLEALKKLFTQGLPSFWRHINGGFLLTLVSGIITSLLSLAKLMTYLLDYHPILIWSFFFGLIIASIILVAREIRRWYWRTWLSISVGTAIAYAITIATPTTSPDGFPFLFFAGFIAIIAMILPGISGAFILLLMGAYATVVGFLDQLRVGIASFDPDVILYSGSRVVDFALGCVIGLMSFSRVLSWMFHHHKNSPLALLTGFMIGSQNKIWPWKTTTMTRVAHEGKENEAVVAFLQDNVWPWEYGRLNELDLSLSIVPDTDPQVLAATGLMLAGTALILFMNRFAPPGE